MYIQKGAPSADKKSNWLPAPDGPIYMGDAAVLAEGNTGLDSSARRGHVAATGFDGRAVNANRT